MKTVVRISVVAWILLLSSCANNNKDNKEDKVSLKPAAGLIENVLTAEEQAKLTPEDVLGNLKEGNLHFVKNSLTPRNYPLQVRKSAEAQFPEAIILSCIDSRVPVENVFDKGIGDLFVARVAGNFVNEDILGCLEFGCKVSGAKLILVLGHDNCGAVKSAIDDVKLGNITQMLQKIKPAIEKSAGYQGDKSSKNEEFVDLVCRNNVFFSINEIKAKSPILKEMSDSGKIKIVGAVYDMKTGIVKFFE
jgi:carbonic anhydrase